MFLKTLVTFTIPLTIYSIMGLVIARIQLRNSVSKGAGVLAWLQFVVDFLYMVFLWPLVLFIEKSKTYLKTTDSLDESQPVQDLTAGNIH